MKIYRGSISTIVGTINLYGDESFLLFVEFENGKRSSRFNNFFSPFELVDKKNDLIEKAEEELKGYFSGKLKVFTTPVKFITETLLSIKVFQTLLENVPFGKLISYKELSGLSGIESGARFVGNVMSRNNFPIFIPCHRVIRSDGKIGGYSNLQEIKVKLVNFERSCMI